MKTFLVISTNLLLSWLKLTYESKYSFHIRVNILFFVFYQLIDWRYIDFILLTSYTQIKTEQIFEMKNLIGWQNQKNYLLPPPGIYLLLYSTYYEL